MSLADRGAPHPTAGAPVYTVHTGEQQGRTNYGFHPGQPQEPPPKYEDVVSGEYLKWNLVNCDETSTRTSLPTQLQSEPQRQEEKEKSHKAAGALLFALLLTVIFIWRVSTM